ncbi:MAG: WXG100 family type VII secretion target [Lachnospiraceae bacterium]|nr:WXG100 family type VII secretion target [Lachnospiraceae bacterium]
MIRVTSQKLRETKDQLEQMNNNLKGKAEEFTTSANSLLSKWDGDAKQVMDTNFKNDRIQMDNFIALIREYCTALENQATRYDNAEAQNVQLASDRSYK